VSWAQPAGRRARLVLLTVLAVVVLAAVAVLVVLRFMPDGERPVLLVPGAAGAPADWEGMAAALGATGRDVTVVELPVAGTGDLWDSAWTLGQIAGQVLERTGADTVDVVAHAEGGVVARLWVGTEGADLAHRVVTLGAPHQGVVAATGDDCPEACRQLSPGSYFLAELADVDQTPGRADWISLWSDSDDVVPADSARQDGALGLALQDVCVTAVVDHDGLLTVPRAVNLVVAELRADEPVAYGRDDCARLSAG